MRSALFVAVACRYRGPLRYRAMDALRAGQGPMGVAALAFVLVRASSAI